MNKNHIIEYLKDHPAGKVKLAITDVEGILRGKYVSTEKFLSIIDDTFGFCSVVFGWDMADQAYENSSFTGWHTGYPDAKAKVDLNTFRKIPWENDVPFFLADFIDDADKPLHVCPRQLLKTIINQADKEGLYPYFSQEFEWFNFEETPHSIQEKSAKQLKHITPGMFGYSILRSTYRNDFFNALFENLNKFHIPIEGLHTETGPGVYEAAIRYSETLEAADRAILFKSSVKELAYKHGMIATFMAKINEDLPGCSGHIHQSLWNKESLTNLFYDEKDELNMSTVFRSYLAGQIYCLPFILPMFAPNINSYKRLVEGAWAPTTLTWAVDNRTTAFRVLQESKTSTRLETRIPGSDTNPYLAMAACLASGLYGIRNNLTLQQPTSGNGYEDTSHGKIPGNLWEATHAMKNSEVAKELFGEGFVSHFVQSREWEWQQYCKVVTDWELKRYLEII